MPKATKDMSLREFLSTLSFQPKHAEDLSKLFRLADQWREEKETGSFFPAAEAMLGACAYDLDFILGEP